MFVNVTSHNQKWPREHSDHPKANPPRKPLCPFASVPMGIAVKNEQRGAEEWRGDNEQSVFSTQCLVPSAGCCRQSRENNLILPTMTQTAICYLNPYAQCGGRVKVAFQIRWKRQASVVADSQDCRTYLLNEHSPELMKQPTFQLFRGHRRCPKPRPTIQRTAVPQTFKSTANLV